VTLLFVRHAVAKARHRWDGDDDSLRPLNERGRLQAELLVGQLEAYSIDAVYSSAAVRCVDTVAPLAAARGLAVEVRDPLFEGNGREAVRFVRQLLESGANVALCSHGDVIPEVLDALGFKCERCAKGSTWVIGAGEASYLGPPA
jgi:8-oxo-dGTP diphosphatase